MSSSEQPSVLIVAPSGRALAAAARRAGYRPLVADFFNDLDTEALAAASRQVASHRVAIHDDGFAADIIDHVRELARGHAPVGLVYGGGFEDRPQLIADLAHTFHLFGNAPEAVARVKDPGALAELCHTLAIPHPEIRFDPPDDPTQWLIKRIGGGGGLHVGPADGRQAQPGDYFQRRCAGRSVSAILLCDGTHAQILGLSAQWTAPCSGMPFRYGGAVQPAELSYDLSQSLTLAAEKIAVAAGLVGLNSVDFLVNESAFHLLEINPRPGATLDIFADRDGQLFAAHIAACEGRLPQAALGFPQPRATAIFYTPVDVSPMPQLDWPDWCHDRQRPGSGLQKGDPVCTIAAEADTPAAARALVDLRLTEFSRLLIESASKEAAA